MQMVKCPHCGAENSSKREYCFQCNGALQGAPAKADEGRGYVPTCANCAQAAIFPPPGHQLTPDEVWCTEQERAVPSGQVAGDCFSEAFGWKREDILD
jgi:NAD-dependent SIR2 family protein deacetylase